MSASKSIFLLFFCFANLSQAILTPYKINLPFPPVDQIDKDDGYMLAEVAALDVFKDSEDSDQYYYLPLFHIRQYSRGAGSLFSNATAVKQYAAAQARIDARDQKAEEYTVKWMEQWRQEVDKKADELQKAKIKLDEVLDSSNKDRIALWQDSVDRAHSAWQEAEARVKRLVETIENTGSIWPPYQKRMYNNSIATDMAFGGMRVPYDGTIDPDLMYEELKASVDTFATAYGGFLSLNVYGGFTIDQLRALRNYKMKYFPNIKVSLLPIEKLTFFPLTEMHTESESQHKSAATPIFRQIKGAGDYLGTALVLDTTIAGSQGFAQHLSPFIVPIGIKATLNQEVIPTEAELHCDFTNGYEVKGRADIRDGLIIYDNDITDTIKGRDSNDYG